jgi:vesicle coat complex subunit
MTVGKDVSMLFTDVINCIQTASIELKKLVYLYLINYAKSQPDLAILAVNTFVKDSQDANPLVRALAVRTMGCIRVDKITEYLCEPLRKCLKVRVLQRRTCASARARERAMRSAEGCAGADAKWRWIRKGGGPD